MAGRRASRALDDVDASLDVGYTLSASATARHALVDSLAGQDVDPGVVHEASVVVSELVTNAVQHSSGPADARIHVAWTLRKGVVEVAVTDPGSDTEPRPVRHHVLADHGRGLRIVRALAHEWGVLDHPHGRTVWASCGGPSRRRTR